MFSSDITCQLKLKLRRKRRNEIANIYADWNTVKVRFPLIIMSLRRLISIHWQQPLRASILKSRRCIWRIGKILARQNNKFIISIYDLAFDFYCSLSLYRFSFFFYNRYSLFIVSCFNFPSIFHIMVYLSHWLESIQP